MAACWRNGRERNLKFAQIRRSPISPPDKHQRRPWQKSQRATTTQLTHKQCQQMGGKSRILFGLFVLPRIKATASDIQIAPYPSLVPVCDLTMLGSGVHLVVIQSFGVNK